MHRHSNESPETHSECIFHPKIKRKNCKKYIFKICYYNIFSFVKSNQIYLVEITYYFEFLMIKLIYFIVLTYFFQFNQLKILRQPSYLLF